MSQHSIHIRIWLIMLTSADGLGSPGAQKSKSSSLPDHADDLVVSKDRLIFAVPEPFSAVADLGK